MGIRIKKRQAFFNHEDSYTVCLPRRNRIDVTVTAAPYVVRSWLYRTRRLHYFRHRKLVVGLGVQWGPANRHVPCSRVATLQLCVGHRCLIFLILYARAIPRSLRTFLAHNLTAFVGIRNPLDADYLYSDHDLWVHALFDLRRRAAEFYGRRDLLRASLGRLAWVVLGMQGPHKDVEVGMSDWDALKLKEDQVGYACVDAFVSFEMGRVMRAWEMNN